MIFSVLSERAAAKGRKCCAIIARRENLLAQSFAGDNRKVQS
jgi:hypothetical protein